MLAASSRTVVRSTPSSSAHCSSGAAIGRPKSGSCQVPPNQAIEHMFQRGSATLRSPTGRLELVGGRVGPCLKSHGSRENLSLDAGSRLGDGRNVEPLLNDSDTAGYGMQTGEARRGYECSQPDGEAMAENWEVGRGGSAITVETIYGTVPRCLSLTHGACRRLQRKDSDKKPHVLMNLSSRVP
jgi:hypothetical protein